MKLFNFNKKDKALELYITEADKNWIEENFKWLIQLFGYPPKGIKEIMFTDEYFPKTFKSGASDLLNPIEDFCQLFGLDPDTIETEIHRDIRDHSGTPFEIQGAAFQMNTEFLEKTYKIHIANSLLKKPNKLISFFLYEFVKIKLKTSKVKYDTGEDDDLFIYLAGVFFGAGIMLLENLSDVGRSDDGVWETKWNELALMPEEVMVFAIALFASLTEQSDPEWKKQMSGDQQKLFDTAVAYLAANPSEVFNKEELDAYNLYNQTFQLYEEQKYNEVIAVVDNLLTLAEDTILVSDALNMRGYCHILNGNYDQAIADFQQSITYHADNGIAYDNLGYCLIMTGKLEEGKVQLDMAMQQEANEISYTYRNYAIYYEQKYENDQARSYFEMALKAATEPVDLLEFFYANFLIRMGETAEAMKYLKIAAANGETEAIERLNELGG